MRKSRTWVAAAVTLTLVLPACSPRGDRQPNDKGPQPRVVKTVSKDGTETFTTIMPEK
jgi:hypothetical protein